MSTVPLSSYVTFLHPADPESISSAKLPNDTWGFSCSTSLIAFDYPGLSIIYKDAIWGIGSKNVIEYVTYNVPSVIGICEHSYNAPNIPTSCNLGSTFSSD